jgi:hypothetical protein
MCPGAGTGLNTPHLSTTTSGDKMSSGEVQQGSERMSGWRCAEPGCEVRVATQGVLRRTPSGVCVYVKSLQRIQPFLTGVMTRSSSRLLFRRMCILLFDA